MARRSVVLFILIICGVLGAFYFVRPNKSVVANDVNSLKTSALNSSSATEEAESGQQAAAEISKVLNSSAPKERTISNARLGKNDVLTIDEKTLESSALFTGTRWKVLKNTTALQKGAGEPKQKILSEVTGYYLVEDSQENDPRQFYFSRPLVAYESRLDVVGVVTGTFTVTLREGFNEEVLHGIEGLKVLSSSPEIRTYYVTAAQEPFSLLELQEVLRKEPSVENVRIEILSRRYEKN
ncbi:hypothetical protein [Bdellovibrio bacteriovorus]|uniref:hypothetical protein n=1 Tax=Bdellovibrio bacteriovorus TaxID=959 RepID=UPI0035A74272